MTVSRFWRVACVSLLILPPNHLHTTFKEPLPRVVTLIFAGPRPPECQALQRRTRTSNDPFAALTYGVQIHQILGTLNP
jgi:hypothetical protein